MSNNYLTILPILALTTHAPAQVAHFDMTLSDGRITELVSGVQAKVESQLPAFNVDGLEGKALRFDGYSNYIQATIPTTTFSDETLTATVLLAPETYPMMKADEAELLPTYGLICGNLDETTKTGIAFELSSQGDVRFRFASANGFIYTIPSTQRLPRSKWSRITAVIDKPSNLATLYIDAQTVGSTKMSRLGIKPGANQFLIGKSSNQVSEWGVNINTYCGLIDDIAIYNKAISAEDIALTAPTPTAPPPDFNYPQSRYKEGRAALWRPKYHAMPSGAWTNETHGMIWSGGRYHLFFQKNANGPYMARLHWGHISSADLCTWTEEPIAFGPSESYDIKGCWSGCVIQDGEVTSGQTGALYTAVDNAKATICLSTTDTPELTTWQKHAANPLIDGRPQGLSDDFRDPYYFQVGNQKYIIVGTSKDGLGACTLHRYESGKWSNDGSIFFQSADAVSTGPFWEMPNITDMGGGIYLFTVTPLGTSKGVRTLYWLGNISDKGTFTPLASKQEPSYLEMGGIGIEGYGLLSPTICRHNGKTLLLGIVPDKLPTEQNLQIGWAHNYSLPREITLAPDYTLHQKPYSGLATMRSDLISTTVSDIQGTVSLAPVSGRQIELQGEFVIGTTAFGFNFLKSGSQKASLTYTPTTNQLTLDLTKLERYVNDDIYGGKYQITLPEKPVQGEKLKIDVYLDGSIADIFVADKWAFSVRIFPTDAAAIEAEAFAESYTQCNIRPWNIDPEQASTSIQQVEESVSVQTCSQAYSLSGQKCKVNQKGIIIQGGKTYVRN